MRFCQCKSETHSHPRPASEALHVHRPTAATGALWSSQGAPSTTLERHTRASPLGHHPQGITTRMLQHWGITMGTPPLGHHHQGSTTRAAPPGHHHQDAPPPGLHQWLLVLHVPKAFPRACADPLKLPSLWLRRRGLSIGYRESPACNGAWCHPGPYAGQHQSFCP